MDKLKLDIVGGMPLKLDDLLWQNGDLDSVNWGLVDGIQADLLAYGTDYIVEGCTYAAPNITAGWIMLDSELMRVDAHAGTDDFFVKTITFDARGSKTFKNTTVNNTYEKNRGVLSGASGSLNVTTALRLEDKIIQLLATSTQKFSAGNIPLATESAVGGQELATTAEAQALTLNTKIITPSTLSDVNGGLLTTIVNIGDWNIFTTQAVSIAHGLTLAKIRGVNALIRNDADTLYYPMDSVDDGASVLSGGIDNINSTTVKLTAIGGGIFNNANFSTTPYNRGWIIIKHIP